MASVSTARAQLSNSLKYGIPSISKGRAVAQAAAPAVRKVQTGSAKMHNGWRVAETALRSQHQAFKSKASASRRTMESTRSLYKERSAKSAVE